VPPARRDPPRRPEPDHEPGREAGLGRGGARVALEAVRGLERRGEVAQERRQVAAGVALEQDGRDERVPGPAPGSQAQALEHRLRRLAEVQRPRRDQELVAGRAGDRASGLGQRAADRVTRPDRVGERTRGAGRPAPELISVAAPSQPDEHERGPRAGERGRGAQERAAHDPARGEQRARREQAEPPPLRAARFATLAASTGERRQRQREPVREPRALRRGEAFPRAEDARAPGRGGEPSGGAHSRASRAASSSPSGARQVGRPARSV